MAMRRLRVLLGLLALAAFAPKLDTSELDGNETPSAEHGG